MHAARQPPVRPRRLHVRELPDADGSRESKRNRSSDRTDPRRTAPSSVQLSTELVCAIIVDLWRVQYSTMVCIGHWSAPLHYSRTTWRSAQAE
ncbi:hypothetical protein GUJ93_ZPchr0006g41135 [Zizania palustris]|uniref:Uncharacterized protein n=1 Tax=Zizania palustris TaxID=103762 RepID=A0A8J5T484_ZIZPA|nr:hypothetical protein GUJ93_ZPchr0006g41135 [Zizania palustris]